ncbi:hypothetical protein CPC08DRAFT_806363 [Agrocybe pediades]|nr:hypothetical protein CPC08DRAFT_806363 [Agrocybe pediades]
MIIDSKEKPLETPPNYDSIVPRPRPPQPPPPIPAAYSFTQWAQNSMFVMPPGPNQQPLYRVTVEMDLNPFLPVSYVTKIYRCGGGGHTELIGEFAFAVNNKRAVIRMGDTTTRLSSALYSVNSSPRHFNWILGNRLHWDCRQVLEDGSPRCVCYLPSDAGVRSSTSSTPESRGLDIAIFTPPPPDRSPPLPDATLLVYPYGHQLLDEIIVSALVVERMLTR